MGGMNVDLQTNIGEVCLVLASKDRLHHAAASCFALVVHLVSRLLPMPLAVDDASWPRACFWTGDEAGENVKAT